VRGAGAGVREDEAEAFTDGTSWLGVVKMGLDCKGGIAEREKVVDEEGWAGRAGCRRLGLLHR
jgi:hypothetical protein